LVEENAANFFERKKGHAFLAFDGGGIGLQAKKDSILFRAAVPIKG
jgi:hypothetical protein